MLDEKEYQQQAIKFCRINKIPTVKGRIPGKYKYELNNHLFDYFKRKKREEIKEEKKESIKIKNIVDKLLESLG